MASHLNVRLEDEAASLALGAALAAQARSGRVLHLAGDLGSGKTTLVRGLLRAMGYNGKVKSPTYGLVELYAVSGLSLYHFDFYRFSDPTEWLSSGFREAFNPESLCIVEWPERAAGSLLPPDMSIRLEYSGAGRSALLHAHSPAGEVWLESVSQRFCSR
ncbi:MAG: tRNA (adenosine(37)-N6)-threonylcarbamoyltransferase complex ATPase subunit type 1 TsaE [Betaproteobacteria bacterium]|nr:tRNA (adenosine(37)-N6)-threonylcarbamoyltransferase complex ATPase subunit type 1 TsaE [Betaproteobacteria bacterium]